MKHVFNLLSLALAFALVFYVNHYVKAGDVCRTIWGCFALLFWMIMDKKEN